MELSFRKKSGDIVYGLFSAEIIIEHAQYHVDIDLNWANIVKL
jgi:hypothetical protein